MSVLNQALFWLSRMSARPIEVDSDEGSIQFVEHFFVLWTVGEKLLSAVMDDKDHNSTWWGLMLDACQNTQKNVSHEDDNQ